jgi:hypothetical protein
MKPYLKGGGYSYTPGSSKWMDLVLSKTMRYVTGFINLHFKRKRKLGTIRFLRGMLRPNGTKTDPESKPCRTVRAPYQGDGGRRLQTVIFW